MPRRILHKFGLMVDKFKRSELMRLDNFLGSKWVQFIGVVLLSLMITMLTTISRQILPEELEVGAIASRDIKADRNYEIVDKEATEGFRREASDAVPMVYDLDSETALRIELKVKAAFEWAHSEFNRISVDRRGKKKRVVLNGAEGKQWRKGFEDRLGVSLSDNQWAFLASDGFSERAERSIVELIKKEMKRPIIANRDTLTEQDEERGVTVRRFRTVDSDGIMVEKEWQVEDMATIRSLEEARRDVENTKIARKDMPSERMAKVVIELAAAMIKSNLTLNTAETESRRKAASAAVKSSIIRIKAGEMIIREGSRYEKRNITVLEGIRSEKTRAVYSLEFFGTWLLVILAIIIPINLASKYVYRFKPQRLDYFLMSLVGVLVLALMRIMMIILPAIREAFIIEVPTVALSYLIPVAGGAMLIRMLLNAETTLVFSVVISVVAGLLIQTDIQYTTFVLLSSFGAMIAIAHVDRRSLIMKAGLITGAINAAIILGIRLLGMVTVTEAVSAVGLAWCMFFGFLSGLGCAIFVMVTVPIIESLMNYTTDIKLLELANLNHPLLRELIVSAPGTYHHSHIVGILGEAAAEAIGANPLVVRVGAYYHDIGKMRKPPYFIENAKNGENRHEKLSPHMSALIVQSHVKDGIEMAHAERLPKIIIDMIPQHHGTRMISFFYEKAKSSEDPDIQKIDQKDFQYPGPKPQSREAAILMLADVVEAKVRSLKERSPARIEQVVRKTIDDVFMESQLDECELTLRDLDNIHKAFVRILLGIYHHRIEYPEKDKGEKSRENLGNGAGDAQALPEED